MSRRAPVVRSLCSAVLAIGLVSAMGPAPLLASPPGATRVQDDDIDLSDILFDERELDEDPPADEGAADGDPDASEDMPEGDFDMPMGDFDLKHGDPEPEPAPAPEPPPKKVIVEEPPAPAVEAPSPRARKRIVDEAPPEPIGEGLAHAPEEPPEAESDTVVWVAAGVGAAVGVAALVGAGVGGALLLGGLGTPSGSVTITPR